MELPILEIEGCLAAHAKLAEIAAGLTDEIVRRPSLLPGWTVGHVLTHLARNAEAMDRRIEAALRGEMIEQYEGGVEGRATAVEAGSRREAHELVADVVGWSQRVDTTFASLPANGWAGRCDPSLAASIRFRSCRFAGGEKSRSTSSISTSARPPLIGPSDLWSSHCRDCCRVSRNELTSES